MLSDLSLIALDALDRRAASASSSSSHSAVAPFLPTAPAPTADTLAAQQQTLVQRQSHLLQQQGHALPQQQADADSDSPGSTPNQQHSMDIKAPLASPHSSTTNTPNPPPSREEERTALLLEINHVLLSEIQRLQATGNGGATSTQHAQQLQKAGQSAKEASEDYKQLIRRLQGNLAYMMPRMPDTPTPATAEAKKLPGPAFMQHPPMMPQLKERYERLRDLFPGWPGNDARLMAMSAAQQAGSPVVQQYPQQQQQQQQSANGQ